MYTENKNVPVTDLGGGVNRKILSYSENLMTVELHFQKGAVGAKHSHPHEQIGYIVSGRLIYQEEGCEDKELQTGDKELSLTVPIEQALELLDAYDRRITS